MSKNEVPKNGGFIFLHRSIRSHWIWKDPIKLKWWLDILMECNHSDQKVSIGYELIECRRGQSLNSLLTWSKLFSVDRSSVRRFFKLLENDSMIVTENVQKTTRLTVCNYDTYNANRHSTQPQTTLDATATQPRRNTNNNVLNNVHNNEEEYSAFAPSEILEFEKFEKWILENAPQVARMKEPFTIKQFLEIKKEAAPEKISEVLRAMHNYAKLLTNNRSAYLTLLKWYKKEQHGTHKPGSGKSKPGTSDARIATAEKW